MSIQYDVTNTVAGAGAVSSCAVGRIHSGAQANTATTSGGGGDPTFLLFAKLENKLTIMYEVDPANNLEWNAGTYTIGLNATGASFTWKSTWICWMDSSSNTLASIASSINHNTALFNPGMKTTNLTGIEVPNRAGGDKIYAVMRIKNNSTFSTTLTYVNDGYLITPLASPGVARVHIKGVAIKGAKIL